MSPSGGEKRLIWVGQGEIKMRKSLFFATFAYHFILGGESGRINTDKIRSDLAQFRIFNKSCSKTLL